MQGSIERISRRTTQENNLQVKDIFKGSVVVTFEAKDEVAVALLKEQTSTGSIKDFIAKMIEDSGMSMEEVGPLEVTVTFPNQGICQVDENEIKIIFFSDLDMLGQHMFNMTEVIIMTSY